MKRLYENSLNIWKSESVFIFFLILMIVSDFLIIPFTGNTGALVVLGKIIFFFIIISGTFALTTNLFYRLGTVLFSFLGCIIWKYSIDDLTNHLDLVFDVFQVIFISILLLQLIVKVFEGGKVSNSRLIGAVAAYILIANFFSELYHLLALYFGPSTFSFSDLSARKDFLYFSFTTLTTVGYGDLLPIHPFARSLCNLEALIGQLYPAIFIARIVSLPANDKK